MDTGDLNDAYTVRSLDDLAKIYAIPALKDGASRRFLVRVLGTKHAAATLDAQVRR